MSQQLLTSNELGNITSIGATAAGSTLSLVANNATAVTIANTGYVGIGTSSASYPLDVYQSGNGNLARFSNSSGIPTFIASYGSTGGIFGDSNSYTGWGLNSSSNYVVALTNNSEKMRIDSSGNLGLGVTPSAWNASYKAVDIGQAGCLYSDTAYATVILGTNFYNAASNPLYKQSSVGASKFVQYNGQFSWYNASSNTSGNPVSFTQAMTLDNSGNLDLGVTSSLLGSTGAASLTVNGSAFKSIKYTGGSNSGGTITITPSGTFNSVGDFCFMVLISAHNTNNSNYNRVQLYLVTYRATNFSGSSITAISDTHVDTGTNGEITTMSAAISSYSTYDLSLTLTTATRGSTGSVYGTVTIIGG